MTTYRFLCFRPNAGMRQYWRDFESLETWARSLPHRQWRQSFVRDSGGTYFRKGGIEAIYDDVPAPLGLLKFAPNKQAHGAMFSARKRAGVEGEARVAGPMPEE